MTCRFDGYLLRKSRFGFPFKMLRRQSYLDPYEVVSNRLHDQIRDGLKAQFPHDIAAVRFDSLGAWQAEAFPVSVIHSSARYLDEPAGRRLVWR